MKELTDQQILRIFCDTQSEDAFAELVRRHINIVHSSALRVLRDPHLAQDVTQRTFLALAQNAGHLAERSVLSGWLHRTTQNIATKTIRTEVRRRAREQEAMAMNECPVNQTDRLWQEIAPTLDSALNELTDTDRDMVMLRYFEGKSAQQIAQTVGVSPEAAQKRVNRAVERLRELLHRRGLSVTSGALAAVLSVSAVQAAPVELASNVVHAASHAASASSALVSSNATIISVAKALLASILLAGVVTTACLMRPRVEGNSSPSTPAPSVITTASGLKYQPLRKGSGSIYPQVTDTVSIHYQGALLDGTIFESSLDRGRPLRAPLQSFIPGWIEGLQLMAVGDKFRFEIPPHLAYGDKSRAKIPPNSTLVFEIELLAIDERHE